ncbi:MAG: folylpolyglutamate synthase/dihydrofolate synthase family protein [Blastocatellia bacterium]
MNFTESVQYLYGLGHEMTAVKLELESIRALCHALGDPQRRVPAVHIAGTNGKGSTSAMIEAIVRAAGLRVGLYTSPHLVEITERMRVDGRHISPDEFARLATKVRAAGEQLVSDDALPATPTFFEQVTAIAFLYFVEREVELAILEVGIGGRLDATNICEPLVCAITPVSADHQQYLGHTLPEIAAEKAGIVKTSAPVVVAPQEPEAMKVITEKCALMKAPVTDIASLLANCQAETKPSGPLSETGLYHLRYRTEIAEYETTLNLRGRHQVVNACTAIHLAEKLQQHGLNISQRNITDGPGRVEWPGRLELMATEPAILLDGAHNPAGARVLRDFLDEFISAPVTMIFGLMSDKALTEIAEILFPAAHTIIATRISNPRATDPRLIAQVIADGGWQAVTTESAAEALSIARQITPTDGLICVCGSLYLIGEMKRELNRLFSSTGR